MAKSGDQIQAVWQNGQWHITEPRNMIKGLVFVGALPPIQDGDECLCRVISDTHSGAHQIGTLRVCLLRTVEREWILRQHGTKLYGCCEVVPEERIGIRVIRHAPEPPPAILAAVEKAKGEYAAALARAHEALAPFFLERRGLVQKAAIRIDLPELKGELFTRARAASLHIGPISFTYEFVKQEGDTLWQAWCFRPDGEKEGEEVGRVPIATRLGPVKSILDFDHTVSELGLPTRISFTGLKYISFAWESGTEGDEPVFLRLTTHLTSETERARLIAQVLTSPIGPEFQRRMVEAQEEEEQREKEMAEAAARHAEREAHEREARQARKKAAPVANPPAPPATLGDLRNKFNRKKGPSRS